MKVLGITSYRCGSGYTFESISQILGVTYLNEIMSQAVPIETYTFNDNIISINYKALDSDYDRLAVNSPIEDIKARIEWLIKSDNGWVAKIHIDQLQLLDKDIISQLMKEVNPVFLYREDTYERILSMILSFEMNKYRFGQDDNVPDIVVEYDYDRHKGIIKRIIDSVKMLKDIRSKYNWYREYKYEQLTHDPNIDFRLFGYKENIKTPKISFIDKEHRIKNAVKIKEDFSLC